MKKLVDVCDVCALTRGDMGKKPVSYWGCCKALICKPCSWRVDKRTLAAITRAGRELVAALKEVV